MNIFAPPDVRASSSLRPGANATRNNVVEVVVISLPSATERRGRVSTMLEGSGLNWSYFDAHRSLVCTELRYDEREIKRCFGRTLSLPEVAVYSSQFAVLKKFLDSGTSDYVLVLEDDVIYDVDFPLGEFAAFCAERKIDYIRLFGKHPAKSVRVGFFYDRSIMRYETSPAG